MVAEGGQGGERNCSKKTWAARLGQGHNAKEVNTLGRAYKAMRGGILTIQNYQ